MMGITPLTLCLTLLAQNPNWPVRSVEIQTSELERPENQPGDPEYFNSTNCRGQFELFGFHPECAVNRNPDEIARSVGIHVDEAWSVTVGDPRILLAVFVEDIRWNDIDLVSRWHLNRKELPVPSVNSSADPQEYDRNEDGVFNILDYTSVTGTTPPTLDTVIDEELLLRQDRGDANKNNILDPEDLLLIYSNNEDEDQNGKVDDICGWDFIDEDAHVSSSTRTDQNINKKIRVMVAEANNNWDIAGACPKCSVIALRTTNGERSSVDAYLRALRYGSALNAKVFPLSNPPAPQDLAQTASITDTLSELSSDNRIFIVDAGDKHQALYRSSWTSKPSIVVGSLSKDHVEATQATTFQQPSPCKNFGPEMDISVPGDCKGLGLSISAGAIGLILSAANGIAERGINPLVPPLTSEELRHILRSSTVNVWSENSREIFRESGYGKLNTRRAVDAIVQRNIPIVARLTRPAPFSHIDATFGETFNVTARIENTRHASVEWKIDYAVGMNAAPEDFEPVAQGNILQGETIDATTEIPTNGLFSDTTSPPLSAGTHALSIRVTTNVDINGNVVRSQDRNIVFVHSDLYSWPNFPKKTNNSPVGSAVLLDVNNDEMDDIVFMGEDKKLHAITTEMQPLSGWPVKLRVSGAPKHLSVSTHRSTGERRFIVTSDAGEIEAIEFTGRPSPNFPVSFVVPTNIPYAPLIFDIDGDESPEIFATSSNGVMLGWNALGERLKGLPLSLDFFGPLAAGYFSSERSPGVVASNHQEVFMIQKQSDSTLTAEVVATLPAEQAKISDRREHVTQVLVVDLDRDLSDEIVFSYRDGRIYVADLDSSEPSAVSLHDRASLGLGSKVRTQGDNIFAMPGFAGLSDLDQDGTFEFVSPASTIDDENHKQTGAINSLNYLFGAWNLSSGVHSRGFPVIVNSEITGPVAIVDLDGDQRPEVIFEDGYFRLQAVSSAGVSPQGWPKRLDGRLAGPISFGNLDKNGKREICATTTEGSFFIWRTEIENNSALDWPYPRHNLQNTANPRTINFGNTQSLSDDGCHCHGVDVAQPSPLQLLYVGALVWLLFRRSRFHRS